MHFQRYYLGCLAHASYMIADEETKIAAIVDPQRDVDHYLADAAELGFQIKYVFLTHFHADFVAGHLELRDKAGAKIYLGEQAQAEYGFTPVKDGDVVEFGKVRLSILETPGHTPEGITVLVYDLAASDRSPFAALTGDTLFVGDVGRPDLLASVGVTADELAGMLYDSLHEKLMKLPDETRIYPAHGAGSMCGKQLGSEAFSTIGEQRKYNYALQPMSREQFKELVTAEQPEAPEYFVHDAILNRQERQTLHDAMQKSLVPLSLDEAVRYMNLGAQVVDVREPIDFAAAHLMGSLNVGLEGKYATWAGTVLKKERPIVVVAEEGREEEAVMRLGRIGYDHVLGYLEHGPEALEPRPDVVAATERITVRALSEQFERGARPLVLDVRTEKEWSDGHIEGSKNIPLNRLAARVDELPADGAIAVHCKSGYRSSIATSLLEHLGRSNLLDVVGGFDAWAASQLPVSRGEAQHA